MRLDRKKDMYHIRGMRQEAKRIAYPTRIGDFCPPHERRSGLERQETLKDQSDMVGGEFHGGHGMRRERSNWMRCIHGPALLQRKPWSLRVRGWPVMILDHLAFLELWEKRQARTRLKRQNHHSAYHPDNYLRLQERSAGTGL